MTKKERIFLSSPHMGGGELKYIKQAFERNWIAPLGFNVDAFEKELAAYNGVKAASALSSGTAAIHLALKLLNIKPKDRVFCSTLTFVASANPILYEGATPVFIDAEPDTWNMSPKALERALDEAKRNNKLPKAVIVVHLYGQAAKMDEIMTLCKTYGVPLIEDAAESLGSTYKGQKTGTFGDFGVYSFNGNKIITTSGGGALVSEDERAIEHSRFLATQAREPVLHYEHEEIGYNYRMSNIVAGIGRGQLEVLDQRIKERRQVFFRYQEALRDRPGVHFQPELEETTSNRWLTALTLDRKILSPSRNEVIETLANDHIEARPVWKPMHLQPLFKDALYYPHHETYSVSDRLFYEGLCLPSGSNLSIADQERVIDVLLKVMKE